MDLSPGRLFGTDGVRGTANRDLTPELALNLARAAAQQLRGGTVLVGRDTRRSGPMLAASIHAGFQSVGIDTIDVGIVPTGAVSFLTTDFGAQLGVVVSASHNPADDNGIKFMGRDGAKLSDAEEMVIEERLRAGNFRTAISDKVGTQFVKSDAMERYVDSLAAGFPYSLRGVSIAVDCANGAAFQAAPHLFERLKADVEILGAAPDGTNINDGCGATNPGYLAERAPGKLGLAFDGDADRLVAVDEDGVPANGDVLMAIIAKHLKERGQLKNNLVVTTVMANLGFRKAMRALDIEWVETKVGDRHVLEMMRERSASFGGEQSGHVIFLNEAATGDGLRTGLRLLEVIASSGRELRQLRRDLIEEFPQVLHNVEVENKDGLQGAADLWTAVANAESELGSDGRILVRASGTEPLVRVMVEADTKQHASDIADRLATVVKAELG